MTTELASKPLPFTVMTASAPWGTTRGESPVTAGVGLLTEKSTGAEFPPPGVGFERTTVATCPAASADAGTVAWRLVALT